MKYRYIIELDEPIECCMHCPLMNQFCYCTQLRKYVGRDDDSRDEDCPLVALPTMTFVEECRKAKEEE